MGEGSVMEIFKHYLWIFVIFFIISLTIFCVQFGQITSFKEYVNNTIEREGGLTESAVEQINKHSNKYYNGRYSIDSEKLNKKVQFGEIVDYTITATYEISLFDIPAVEKNYSGSATSEVR